MTSIIIKLISKYPDNKFNFYSFLLLLFALSIPLLLEMFWVLWYRYNLNILHLGWWGDHVIAIYAVLVDIF